MERFVDIINKKRLGKQLSDSEIDLMIAEYVNGNIPDYQMSAMLMAICFQGLTEGELTRLTLAMRDSGETLDLSSINGIKVDKHSTGGVGDKTTLIIGPIVAACGVPVAKMSGRGLGFTGGTIDKLESIPGFKTSLDNGIFFKNVNELGLCVVGQTADLAPADKLLYALRDVTATVQCIELIASSIMSKKLAAGADKILLDVTTGSGAFMTDPTDARLLAEKMVRIGNNAGKQTIAQITSMDEPLGFAIGNNLEVKEAIRALRGENISDLMEVCYTLASHMISLGKEIPYEEARKLAEEAISSGRAFDVFVKMVEAQGGDTNYILNPELFETAAVSHEFRAENNGYLTFTNTAGIGVAAGLLGAGRSKKDDPIDMSAGIVLAKKNRDFCQKGDLIATLYGKTSDQCQSGAKKFGECIALSPEPLSDNKIALIGDVII